MIHSPYPGAASKYVKRIIEIRGCVKDEKSAIIHCALALKMKKKSLFQLNELLKRKVLIVYCFIVA